MGGRHRLYDEMGMTPPKVISLYEQGGDLDKAAKLAGVSRKTFWVWTKIAGMKLERGRAPNPHHHYSCLAEWIREHPGVKLPISPTRIAALTGCSNDAVRSYLKRRRAELAEGVRALPDLREIKGVSMLTTEGYALPLIAISAYSISIPRLQVRISGTLRSGRAFTISTSLDKLQSILPGSGINRHTES